MVARTEIDAKDDVRYQQEANMKTIELTLPKLALIAGTRGALGAGLALLLGGKLKPSHKKALGWTLFVVGAVSTIPLAIDVLSNRK